MNGTKLSTAPHFNSAENYSGVVYSRVIFDNDLPVLLVSSVDKILRQRKVDVQRINGLTEKAKRTLDKINRR